MITIFLTELITLLQLPREVEITTLVQNLVATSMELQSRAIVLTRVIGAKASKGSSVEMIKLNEEMAESTSSLKASLEANVALEERACKVET